MFYYSLINVLEIFLVYTDVLFLFVSIFPI
jgi:hypothetical protein